MSSWSSRAVGVVALLLVVAGCSHQAALETLRREPIVQAPPGAVELLRTETAGATVGFGTPARVEVVWGVADGEETLDWYLTGFTDEYDLDEQGRPPRYLGGRAEDDTSVNVFVQVHSNSAEVPWDTLIGDPALAEPWDGAIAVARASSSSG
jgi:hypothetical protein